MNILVGIAKKIESKTVNKRLENRMKTRTYTHNKLYNKLLILVLMLASTSIMAQLKLESVDYNSNLDGSVEFHLKFDGDIDKPDVFQTAQPARLAFDMLGVQNESGVKVLPVSKGVTKSMRIVSANNKTRAVIDLIKSAHHELNVSGNELTVTIFGSSGSELSNNNSQDNSYSINNVDFRRGKDGQGRVIVTFNKPGALVNLRETADTIQLDMKSTALPERLDNKLDVIDFATPVSFVDVKTRNGDVKVVINAEGAYEHFAYQTGNQYVIEISELEEEVENNASLLVKDIVYEGHKVSFNFQDIEVRSVLQLIADASQLNLVVADTVEGNVTLRLNDVPWDQALDIVLNSKQLDKRRKDNVIWIAPAKEIADREQQELETLRGKEEFEPLRTIYIQINYAKAEEFAVLLTGGKELEGNRVPGDVQASGLLSPRGSVSFDERTNTLLVSDISDKLREVEEIVRKLDIPVRQVQIESRIVIATDKFGDELGVKFGVTGSKEDSHGNILSTGGSLDALDRLNSRAITNRNNSASGSGLPNFAPGSPSLGERLNVNLPAVAGNAGGWAFSILAADYLLDLELTALETEGRGEVVSTPRVVTTNQKEATIKQGVQIPYEETAASPTGVPTISFKDAVLELKVTPLITPDDRVDLTLKVTKNTVGQFFNGVPSIDTREIDTRVLVGNGQTIVLGGVYEQVKLVNKSKVPILGDIPGLGALFRNKAVQNDKAELLIFITPTIIKESL